MGFAIVEIPELSGPCCKIYSIAYDGSEDTLLDSFLDGMLEQYPDEVTELWNRLMFMGLEGGAREQFFRLNEGKPGDGVVALLKEPDFPLRLYGIRYGTILLVLGSGGYKPKGIRSWQDDPKLSQRVEEMIRISEMITNRIKDKDIIINNNGSLEGELIFED